jgi:Protein of unknown function (DUF3891)
VLLRREPGDEAVIAIGQASHAWLSGQLARAWGNERFGTFEPHEEVCLGAEQHDVGMARWDLSPALNPETGLPRSFMEMDLQDHLALWSAAPEQMFAQSRYAALLVSLHGTALYEQRDLTRLEGADADLIRAYLGGQRALQDRLTAELGADPAELRRNQRLVLCWDWLSLALCLEWAPASFANVPAAGDETELRIEQARESVTTVHPWPFSSDELGVRCEGRRLTGRFAREPDLHEALERAPLASLDFTLVRSGRG